MLLVWTGQQDGKRLDGTTLLPWARGEHMAWNATVPGTYAESHSHAVRSTCQQSIGQQDS